MIILWNNLFYKSILGQETVIVYNKRKKLYDNKIKYIFYVYDTNI